MMRFVSGGFTGRKLLLYIHRVVRFACDGLGCVRFHFRSALTWLVCIRFELIQKNLQMHFGV